MAKICLDPGHSGLYNQSPVVPAYYESIMNIRLAVFLRAELEKRGHEIIMTRTEQYQNPSLEERGKASEGCDLFLSLHSDAAGAESIDHPSAYALTDDTTTKVDDISQEIAALLAPAVAKTMGTNQAGKVKKRMADYDRNQDGLMNDNYYAVLHYARQVGTPGIIMEHSFHTNTRTANWLLKLANLEKLAIAEAEVLTAYFEKKLPAEKAPVELYRVQVGAFREKANAQAQLEKVEAAGFDAFIAYDNKLYRVQVGAFREQSNAVLMLQKITKAGFQAFVTPSSTTAQSPLKSLEDVAKEVIAGKWGNDPERSQRLTTAGYDAQAVRRRVNELMG